MTLPVVVVDIYTNGDFKLDFGFPWKGDFSRSFAIESQCAGKLVQPLYRPLTTVAELVGRDFDLAEEIIEGAREYIENWREMTRTNYGDEAEAQEPAPEEQTEQQSPDQQENP